MMPIRLTSGSDVASVENKEYFPLYLFFDKSVENIEHVGYYYNDTDLLEFSVDKESRAIRKIVLTLSQHYVISQSKVIVPSDCVIGSINMLVNSHIDCTTFLTTVHTNGIVIKLSDQKALKNYRMDKVILSLDEYDNITQVIILDLSPNNISHTIQELEYGC